MREMCPGVYGEILGDEKLWSREETEHGNDTVDGRECKLEYATVMRQQNPTTHAISLTISLHPRKESNRRPWKSKHDC